jgi:purine-cytosine permease-like protein
MAKEYINRVHGKVSSYPRWVRVIIGILLLIGGVLGFLPVLGFWMIPLGLLVLSYDLPLVRRWRRRLEVAWFRWWRRRREGKE